MKCSTSYRVLYGDTDPMGIMYYANYLRLAEAGRNEFCRQLGVSYRSVEDAGFFFPVIEAHVKYLRPAVFDDVVTIWTSVASRTRVRLEFVFEIMRGEELLASGTTLLACVDRSGRPQRLPKSFDEKYPLKQTAPDPA